MPVSNAFQLHVLLSDVDLGYSEPSPVFDEVLNVLERPAVPWTGNVHDIDEDAHATTAACHLLVSRWLPLLEYVYRWSHEPGSLTI